MKRLIPHGLLLAALVAVVVEGPLARPAQAGPAEPTVPTDIAVPDGNKVFE